MKYVRSRRAHQLIVGFVLTALVATGGCAPPAPTPQMPGDGKPTPEAVVKPSGSAETRRGGTLRFGTSSEWNTLDPPLYTTVSERQIFYSIYDPLVGMNEDLTIVPHLARSWALSSDGLEWTFSLAGGVKFHDGTPFNAQAVKFNLDRLMDPATGSALRQQVAAIKEVQALDDLTVKIILSQPFTPLLAWMAEGPGFMPSPTAVQKWGKEYGRHPVGTGPFEFVEWVKGDHLTLRRFKDYWEAGLPYLDEVVFKPVRDPTVQLAGLRTGTLDLIDDVAANEVAGLRTAQDRKVYELKGARWPMIRLNLAKPPLDNKAIRQALSLAIDRDSIVKAVYFGNATPAFGPISPTYKAVYDPAVEQFGFKRDVARAKEKLAEGGQPNGFTLPLDITGTPGQTRLGELIKAQLAEIGVTVEISTFEPTALTDRMTSRAFVAAAGSWTPRPDVDGTLYGHFHSTGNVNHVSYKNPKVDALLDRTRQLPPGEERTQAFREAQKLVVDDAPWIFLVFETKAMATLKTVEGLPLIPDTMVRPKSIYLTR